ncbi:family 43 glycosylhydrolase [Streptomyces sp. NPDC056704]|uniref:family 43 glycosylhydrolase n=1 Tax=Streptomyces sp. NPDC056704 TaxID=3345917 RepID=UPI0036C41335
MFHLVHSNVSTYAGGFTDSPNHLVTAESIDGPWSDPVPLHARGFDASLFHDGADSRLLNLVHDWRRPWYYLLTADGGTGYDHQVTVARSRTLTGPYERDPAGPLITDRHHPDLPLQKAGHGSLVDTPGGLSYLAYLVARPHTRHGPCVLGARPRWHPSPGPRTDGRAPQRPARPGDTGSRPPCRRHRPTPGRPRRPRRPGRPGGRRRLRRISPATGGGLPADFDEATYRM